MQALFEELKRNRLAVAAQIHTHPRQAFHSEADDTSAIVRHAGALSIVLPFFALKTAPDTFTRDAKVFVLSRDNVWHEVPVDERDRFYQVSK